MLFTTRIGLVLVCAVSSFAQPVVNSVLNAASYLTFPKGDPPMAQGSMFVIFGSGLASSDFTQASGFPLPSLLPAGNGTSIAVTSGGQNMSAYIVFTLSNQVAAILPSGTPIGPASLTLTYNGQSSAPVNIQVVRSAPGIFTANAQGTGPAAAQIAFSNSDVRPNSLTTPAPPGSLVTLYGTGLGPVSGPDNVPPGAIAPAGNVTATIGGKSATVLYAGRAPQFPGEDQINIQLPPDVPQGCYTPGVIAVDGIPSNDFVISTGPAGSNSCAHPMGLTPASEAMVDAGGSVNIGVFAAVSGAITVKTSEGLGGLFTSVNAAELFAVYQNVLWNTHVVPYPAPVGGCVLYDQLSVSTSSSILLASFAGVGGTELQSANSLTLTGFTPASLSRTSTTFTQSIARAGGEGAGYVWISNLTGTSVPSKFTLGNWSLFADAGPDIAGFSANVELPQTLAWTGMTGFVTPSHSGVTMTWTGGYCTLNGLCQMPAIPPNVNIFGNSSVLNPSDPSRNRGKSFSCSVPAPDTVFGIPSEILGALPIAGPQEVGLGSLGVSVSDTAQFLPLMTNGQRIDGGIFGFSEYLVNTGASFAWK
jgi:uncharacterized protein (TIGR03437 family)